MAATNNYARISYGSDVQYVFFNDQSPESVRNALDRVAVILNGYNTSLMAVGRKSLGRDRGVEATVFRRCSSIPFPAVGSTPATRRPLNGGNAASA